MVSFNQFIDIGENLNKIQKEAEPMFTKPAPTNEILNLDDTKD